MTENYILDTNNERVRPFRELIDSLADTGSKQDRLWNYLGTGNPSSDVLIIGKEAAVTSERPQEEEELCQNLTNWKRILRGEVIDEHNGWYNPRFPYRGQLVKQDRDLKSGGKSGGTSATWVKYQKLIDQIYGRTNSGIIDFHDRCFITEVNARPSKQTALANKDSLQYRKEVILASEFVQSFPVVIISGVGYFEIKPGVKNEIEDIFDVNYICCKDLGVKGTGDRSTQSRQPFWMHCNKEGFPPRILINTHQLSMGISNLLIEDVGEVVREFLNQDQRNCFELASVKANLSTKKC